MKQPSFVLLAVTLILTTSPGAAELWLSPLVSDGMVLQRGAVVPISGRAEPGANVRVELSGEVLTARADASGGWRVELPSRSAGGPWELEITAGDEILTVRDVVAGDVWLCSGQSNMEWRVADAKDAEREIAGTDDPGIRHFGVPHSWAAEPAAELTGGAWERADPEHVGGFTAVGTFFARELRSRLGVPIGLINSSWGGSRLEPWMSAESLGLDRHGVHALLEQEAEYERELRADLARRLGPLPARDSGLVDGRAVWADPTLDDSAWPVIQVPAQWESVGYDGMDGIAWYRTSFELTAEEATAAIRLGLGPIDDSDVTWLNGREVGRTTLAWNLPRLYEVPPEVARAGRNVLAVRVEDTGGGGGIYGARELLFVETAIGRRSLVGDWRFGVGLVTVNLDFHKNQVATLLFNQMIHPLLPYPLRGVLWYQGESNAGPDDAFAYRQLFPAMIEDWRARWGAPELPFLWAQLAAFLPSGEEPAESSWALLRESQSKALALPATAQVVLVDAGEADDIHPRNKQVVGRRLALAARRIAYGEDVVWSGPTYRDHRVQEGRVEIELDHVGGGLVVVGDATPPRLAGFTIAGEDRSFVPAEAAVEGERVVVWSDLVPRPVAVRYAWADDPSAANLYNREGLPAAPFRTDSW